VPIFQDNLFRFARGEVIARNAKMRILTPDALGQGSTSRLLRIMGLMLQHPEQLLLFRRERANFFNDFVQLYCSFLTAFPV